MRTLASMALLVLFAICAQAQDKDAIAKHTALLKGGSDAEKVTAAKDLAAIGSADALAPIFEALQTEPNADLASQLGGACEKLTNVEGFKAITKQSAKWGEGRAMFVAFWVFTGIARGRQPAGDDCLKAALNHKLPYVRVAAFEALGEAARSDADSWVCDWLNAFKKDPPEKEAVGVLAALMAAPKVVNVSAPDQSSRNALMTACVNVMALSGHEKIKYFASRALAELSGEKGYLNVDFWRQWLKENGAGEIKRPEDKQTGVRFFEAEAAGRRIVFCIDISGSMDFPLKNANGGKGPITRGKEGKDGPDYSGCKTRLDLAKTELLWTLARLSDDYLFNIVTYSKGHQLIEKETPGFLKASKDNKLKFSNLVRALKADGGTNIHGGLLDSFRVVEKGMAEQNPAYDAKALEKGADTIFFLTDGHPSWSDDSEGKPMVMRDGQSFGTGEMVDAANIAKWFVLTNRFRKVVVNTVGIGDHAKELLQELAKSAFGVYIDRTGTG
ncbi:MAG: hypothetical protein KBG84_05225 [Planctomycetes bacterium]|nr:hypothetical protein [Planctomycetota bacterium]